MTNNTIPNVPRDLLERVLNAGWGSETVNALDDLRDFLESAPSPAGVAGLEVVAWMMKPDLYDPYVCIRRDSDCFGSAEPLCRLSAAQAIIDGLRGEVAAQRVKTCAALKERNDAREERDQHALRIGELEGLLREVHDTYRAAIHWEDLRGTMRRIDAALSAGKEGE